MGTRLARLLVAAVIVTAAGAVAVPSSALAVDCPNNSATSWTNPNGGSWDVDTNRSNGTPTGSCPVTIAFPGTSPVTMSNGGGAPSPALGGASGQQTLANAGSN